MSLQVNSEEVCEHIFTPETLIENGIRLTRIQRITLKDRYKHGFKFGINCVGNDFVISEGMNITSLSKR